MVSAGAEFVRNSGARSTLDTKGQKPRRGTILNNVQQQMASNGVHNGGFIDASSDEEQGTGQDMQMNIYGAGSRSTLGRERHGVSRHQSNL